MTRTAFVNGAFVPFAAASVPITDRGFLFGDGIYEVTAVLAGRLVDADAHLARLERCLAEIAIPNPFARDRWRALQRELIARNALAEGLVYLQVTRGAAERDFAFPIDAEPTVVMFTQAKAVVDAPLARTGARVVSVPDLRWARRDIKSVALLAQVLAKQAAVAAGANEAWMVEDGFVTEGSSSTAYIVTREGALVTRKLSRKVLPGVTRQALLALLAQTGLTLDERPFTLAEAQGAAEAFFTSASALVTPVIAIDGVGIGDGEPGVHARRLRALYLDFARSFGDGRSDDAHKGQSSG